MPIKRARIHISFISGIRNIARKANECEIIIGASLPILSVRVPIGILMIEFGKPLAAYSRLMVEAVNQRLSLAYIGKSVSNTPVAM